MANDDNEKDVMEFQEEQNSDESVLLCTSGYDHTIRFWEAPTAICNRTLQVIESQINTLVISPDKSMLAAGGNPIVKIFDLRSASQEPLQTLEGHTGNIMSIGFDKENKWLFTASEDGTMRIWDLREGKSQKERILDKKPFINSAILHPNQGEIICGDQNGYVTVWDFVEDKIRSFSPEGKIPVRSVTLSSNASLMIVANNKGTCYVYRPSDTIEQEKYKEKNKDNNGNNNDNYNNNDIIDKESQLLPTKSIPFDEDDDIHRRVSTVNQPILDNNNSNNSNKDNKITLVGDGMFAQTHKIFAHSGYCLKCLLSPDGKYLATCSADTLIKIWDVENNFSLMEKGILKGHQKWVWDIAFSADSAYLVSASSDKTAKLWDLKAGQYILEYAQHNKAVTCVALNDSSYE